jgi:plastocyanin
MRQPIAIALCSALLLSLGAGASVAAKTNFSAVQAQGSEFRISLSRSKIKQGKLRLEFVNFGEDPHDLAVKRKGNRYVRNVGRTEPGERGVLRFTVKRGTYTLWCTIGDHRARGMSTKLVVKK